MRFRECFTCSQNVDHRTNLQHAQTHTSTYQCLFYIKFLSHTHTETHNSFYIRVHIGSVWCVCVHVRVCLCTCTHTCPETDVSFSVCVCASVCGHVSTCKLCAHTCVSDSVSATPRATASSGLRTKQIVIFFLLLHGSLSHMQYDQQKNRRVY